MQALNGRAALMSGESILVFETDRAWRESAGWSLGDRALRVMPGFRMPEFGRSSEISKISLVILAPSEADSGPALEVAKRIRHLDRRVALLFVTSRSTEELAIAALRAGITEYLKQPFSPGEFDDAIRRCCVLAKGSYPSGNLAEGGLMVGESLPIRQVKSYIAKVGSTNSNVLITGETGTGKELAAELVHRCSNRRDGPFLTINSAAIPDSLVESELFGFDRGAFTGADSRNEGKLAAANGGSIFLDEIADLSACAQAKILRATENKEVYRLGSRRGISINVRFIAATNQNLEDLVAEGKFRKDLFFRLNVAQVHLPPLRERKEDLPFLLDYFIQGLNQRSGLHVRRLTEETLEHLLAYDWPGNVRELKNLLEAIFVDLPSSEISLDTLPLQFRLRCERSKSVPCTEQDELLRALLSTKWNKSKAAEKLRWSRMTLYRKMARYNISRMNADTGAHRPGQTEARRI
jgi:DNA-binding NtrC family response regulator